MRYYEYDNETAELLFYKNIGSWWISAEDFENTMREIEGRYKKLRIRMHCYGGEVFEGNVIGNRIERSSLKVTIVVEGVAASMGFNILLYCKDVEVAENATGMAHRPKSGCYGGSSDMEGTGKLLRDIETAFVKRMVAKGVKKADAVKYMDGTDYWFNAQEMVDMGVANRIVSAVDTAAEIAGKPDSGANLENIYAMYGTLVALADMPHDDAQPSNKNDHNMNELKKLIIALFGLEAVGLNIQSSDTAIADAVKAKKAVLEQSAEAAKAKLAEMQAGQVDAILASYEAANSVQVPIGQKEVYKAFASANGADALALLLNVSPASAAMQPTTAAPAAAVPRVVALGGAKGRPGDAKWPESVAEERKSWSLSMWAEKDPDGLSELENSDKDSAEYKLFAELYKKEYKVEPNPIV